MGSFTGLIGGERWEGLTRMRPQAQVPLYHPSQMHGHSTDQGDRARAKQGI